MRILSLSNFYPPHGRGGYEQWCEEVTADLRARGHEAAVLTSRFEAGHSGHRDPSWVHRELRLEMRLNSRGNAVRFFTSRADDERRNLECVRRRLGEFVPDWVIVWGMWNVQRSVPALVETLMPDRVAYYLGDYWPTLPSQYQPYWESPARSRLAALVKAPLRRAALGALARSPRPALRLQRVMFPTHFMREELARRGVVPEQAAVVYGAIDTSLYAQPREAEPTPGGDTLRLLTAGRLTEDKGVHTAIEAMATLVHQRGLSAVRLTVVGAGDADYERRLRHLAVSLGVDQFVSFLGPRPKDAMPALYRSADVFLFTATWPEPFGRVVVEAMASGLAVVGTAVGGAAEVLVDDLTALTFEPGNAMHLASQVERLARHVSLRQQLAENGRELALGRFDLRRMTAEVLAFLSGARPAAA